MGRSYYFTTSSLPALSLDQTPPLDWGGFLSALDTEVTAADRNVLNAVDDALSGGACPGSGLLSRYLAWEISLRNDLVRVRAAATGRDPGPWLKEGESLFDTLAVAQQAARIDSPLEAEDFLDRARWRKIDELVTGEFFNRSWLEAYALKLKILLRRSLFERERGERRYNTLYGEILSKSDTDFASGELNG